MFDLQGPKLRVGHFEGGSAHARKGRALHPRPDGAGDAQRVELPHPELFDAIRPGNRILIDDGKVRLKVLEVDDEQIVAEVEVGGTVSDNKGVNVPDVLVPIPALTEKDRVDLAVRARAEGRLDRSVVRPAAGGCRRGALADRRASGAAGQDREAGGDRPAERHHRACRRGDGRARRPRRRASARAGPAAPEQDRRLRPPVRQAGGGRDADARIDDHLADADPRRGQRRRDRDLRRRRRGDAVGGERRRANIRAKRCR